jgi:2'-5' RNA ligase
MQHLISLNPGYPAGEYLVVIQPAEDLCEKINTIKRAFAEKYEMPVYSYSNSNITLLRFSQYEMMEDRIIRSLRSVAASNISFKIELADFGSLPTHTIYIKVLNSPHIAHLVKELKQVQKLVKPDKDHKPHFITEPYVMVAAKLLPWQYEKGWLEYSNSHFTSSFITEQILLLKRNKNQKKYQIVEKFRFSGQQLPSIKARNKNLQLSLF